MDEADKPTVTMIPVKANTDHPLVGAAVFALLDKGKLRKAKVEAVFEVPDVGVVAVALAVVSTKKPGYVYGSVVPSQAILGIYPGDEVFAVMEAGAKALREKLPLPGILGESSKPEDLEKLKDIDELPLSFFTPTVGQA